ncbi:MAG: hypothetical protein ABI551_00325, partial [Polyangiaceae bacterium]
MKTSLALALALAACGAEAPALRTTREAPKAVEPALAAPSLHPAAIAGDVPPPPSWVLRPAPLPASETIECANLSTREWKVGVRDGGIDLALRTRDDDGDPMPFAFHPTKRDEAALHGSHHVQAVEDGVLVGFDDGEYGGALYWFSRDGKARQKLGSENVIGFATLENGLVAVTGLAHLGMSIGHLIHVAKDGAEWKATPWVDLGGAAETFAVESKASMLVLTTGGLHRITASGSDNELAKTNYDSLYPSSMAIDNRGIVYIGMRQFVTRFVPTAQSYREEWLTRDDCVAMV